MFGNINIRWFHISDLNHCHAIEADSFPVAWSKQEFRSVMEEANSGCLVAEMNGSQIVGFLVHHYKTTTIGRRGADCYAQITNIAVDRMFRRRRVGLALVERLVQAASSNDLRRIIALVGGHNLEAHLFLSRIGFRCTSTINRYFADGSEAYRFVRPILPTATSEVRIS